MSEIKISYTQDQIIERMFWDILYELQREASDLGVGKEVIGFRADWGSGERPLIVFAEYKEEQSENGNKSGNIYILESSGYYKIGITKNIKSRLNSLQTANPNKIKLVHSKFISNYDEHECFLHQVFNNSKKNGEWFDLDEAQLQYAIDYINNQQ